MAAPQLFLLPEIIIQQTLERILNYIRTDYTNQTDKTQSLLYTMLNGNAIAKYKFYNEAVSVIMADIDNPRHLYIQLMYNAKSENVPSVYITLPAEQPGQNGLGIDQGYKDVITSTDTNSKEWFQYVFTRRKNATYQLVIVSDNSNEVILLYHFFTTLLISLFTQFVFLGLENPVVSGGDLNLQPTNNPQPLFGRVINLSIQYETSAIDLIKYPSINKAVLQGIPVNEIIPAPLPVLPLSSNNPGNTIP